MTPNFIGIIADQLNVSISDVVADKKIVEDFGADSLDQVELVMALEEEYGIEVPDEDAEKWVTVGDVWAYVEAKTAK